MLSLLESRRLYRYGFTLWWIAVAIFAFGEAIDREGEWQGVAALAAGAAGTLLLATAAIRDALAERAC